MRLLRTRLSSDGNTLALIEVFGKDIPPYAILSHTWSSRGAEDEVTFEDVKHNTATAKAAFSKVRWAMQEARDNHIDYIWIDTCCIDKASSHELSEAINSMWQYYARAQICYAYLADHQASNPSKFADCRWFTRGWTLQELLAPKEVLFYDKRYQYVGSRATLAAHISAVTGIDEIWLMGADFKQASVAARMSWAAKRETTREEDMAYCLIGLFDVNMVMLYGEGELKAFRRLQEEILKVREDHSIFAWIKDAPRRTPQSTTPATQGSSSIVAAQADQVHKPRKSPQLHAPLVSPGNDNSGLAKKTAESWGTSPHAKLLSMTVIDAADHNAYRSQIVGAGRRQLHGLLADSPRDFQHTGFVRQYTTTLARKPPKMTARGINIQLPIWENQHHLYAILSCPAGDPPSSFLAIELVALPATQEQYARSECYVLIAIPHTCKLPAPTKLFVACDPVLHYTRPNHNIRIPLHVVSVARTHDTPAGRWRHVATYRGDDALAYVHPTEKAQLLSTEQHNTRTLYSILRRRRTAQAVLKFTNDKDGSSFVLLLGTDARGHLAFNICDDGRQKVDGHYQSNWALSDGDQWYTSNSVIVNGLYGIEVRMKELKLPANTVLEVLLQITARPNTSSIRLRRRILWMIEKIVTFKTTTMPSTADFTSANLAGVTLP